MIELILIRHGETAWNLERRMQGHLDVPLNATGQQQAQALAYALRDEAIDVILCSDLQRAMETAQAVADVKNLLCHKDPAWRERCYGGFEGQLISTLEERFPADYAAWHSLDPDFSFPANAEGQFTGESLRAFQARVGAALNNCLRHYEGKKVVVVAHGGVLECAYRIARHLPLNAPREITLKNASLNRFEMRAEKGQLDLALVEWGDVRHLGTAFDEIA